MTSKSRAGGLWTSRAVCLFGSALLLAGLVISAVPAAAISIPPSGGNNSGLQAVDETIDGHAHLSSVSCPTSTWCMAGAYGGSVVTYNAGAWGPPTKVFTGLAKDVDGLSCPTTTFCMAISYIGGYSIFSGGKWSKPVASPSGWGVSCPTTSFCLVEEGGFGNIEAWDKGSWSLSFDTEDDPSGAMGQTSGPLSCVPGTANDCAYVDNSDYYTAYTGSWPALNVIPASAGAAGEVSCSEEPMAAVFENGHDYPYGQSPTCTFVDSTGHAFTLHGSKWTASGKVDKKVFTPNLVAVSCVYARCAAVDQSRHVLYQDLFSGGVSSWSQPFSLGTVGEPTDISCASLAFCVVVTASDNAVVLDPDV